MQVSNTDVTTNMNTNKHFPQCENIRVTFCITSSLVLVAISLLLMCVYVCYRQVPLLRALNHTNPPNHDGCWLLVRRLLDPGFLHFNQILIFSVQDRMGFSLKYMGDVVDAISMFVCDCKKEELKMTLKLH